MCIFKFKIFSLWKFQNKTNTGCSSSDGGQTNRYCFKFVGFWTSSYSVLKKWIKIKLKILFKVKIWMKLNYLNIKEKKLKK